MSDQDGGSGDAQKITGEVTVLEVAKDDSGNVKTRPWETKPQGDRPAGKFLGYRIKVKLPDGTEVGNVEVNTKQDNPKFMEPGETAFGVFDPRPGNQYGPRFQKKSPQGGGGGGGRGRGGPSPMEQCRMQRQHSQMVAVDFAAKAGWLDGIEPNDEGRNRVRELVGKADGPLTWLIDLFDFDIDRGAKIALERREQSGNS